MSDDPLAGVTAPAVPNVNKVTYLAVGVGVVIALQLLIAASRYVLIDHHNQAQPGVAEVSLETQIVNPTWIMEGKPAFRALTYSHSADSSATSGIWECDGPARFRWEYSIDESLYIMEGTVGIEYGGVNHTLVPGSTAFMPAGSTVIWTVPGRVKKTFFLSEPGRLRRLLRKFLPPPPPKP